MEWNDRRRSGRSRSRSVSVRGDLAICILLIANLVGALIFLIEML